MSNWVAVTSSSEMSDGAGGEFVVADRVVALFRVGDEYYALDGICPHQGGPLGKGRLSGCVLTCPWHGWQYDVRTGQHLVNQSIRHPSFPVKVEGGQVWVDLGG